MHNTSKVVAKFNKYFSEIVPKPAKGIKYVDTNHKFYLIKMEKRFKFEPTNSSSVLNLFSKFCKIVYNVTLMILPCFLNKVYRIRLVSKLSKNEDN